MSEDNVIDTPPVEDAAPQEAAGQTAPTPEQALNTLAAAARQAGAKAGELLHVASAVHCLID